MIVTFWKCLLEPVGIERDLTWSQVVSRLSVADAFRGDNEQPGWSPVEFTGQRRSLETVQRVFALCLDYDGTENLGSVLERVRAECGGLLHTTRKHTEEAHRFRVVLPLSRSVSAFEFGELWKRVAPWAGRVDPAAKDPSRFWFLPGTKPGGKFEARPFDGSPLDVDRWLAKADPERERVVGPERAPQTSSDIERRARSYIGEMPAAVSGSGGHKSTWLVAVALARGFGLGEDDTLRLLHEYNQRCDPKWTDKELRHKAKGAVKAERTPLGYLLQNNDRYGSPVPNPSDWRDYPDEPSPFSETDAEHVAREPGDDSDEIAQENAKPKTAVETYGVATMRAMYMEVLEKASSGKPERGFPTGVRELDIAIGGLRRGHVTLLAAQTSWGKSSIGVLGCLSNIRTGARPLVVSTEDKRHMYGKRMVASHCKINAIKLRDNELKKDDFSRLTEAISEVPDDPIFLDAVGKGRTVEWVAQAISALAKEVGTSLVILDYLQRFKTERYANDRRNQVTYIGETLADAIKSSNCSGLALSQLKRTNGREPTMDDVKESGDLENMAEHVMIGYRKTENEELPPSSNRAPDTVVHRLVCIPKNKDGPIDTNWVELKFDAATASFTGDSWRYGDELAEQASQLDDFGFGNDFDARFP